MAKSKQKSRGNLISTPDLLFAKENNIRFGMLIGDGVFADVYSGKSGDAKIALKITYRARVSKTTLASELEVLKVLQEKHNKHVVRMSKFMDNPDKSQVWILMEWFVAEDMNAIQKRQMAPFPEKLAKDYFRQMVAGLEFLHSIKIVHRDIKPHNVLIGKNPDGNGELLKYIDFGFSKLVTKAEKEAICSSHKGSQVYMAPELMSDKRLDYDAFKTDIYSLAIVLYEMLFNVLPFGNSDMGLDRSERNDFMQKLKESLIIRYPDGIDVSEDAKSLIENMICADSAKRLTLQQIAAHKWLKQ